MAGGLLNLISSGVEGKVLVGNPSKTFFKKTFLSYTNFGRQKFRIDFEGNTQIRNHSSSVFTFKIPRYADLLQETFFVFDLPNIWSPLVSIGGVASAYCSACRTNIQIDVSSNTSKIKSLKNTYKCTSCGSDCTTDISWNSSGQSSGGIQIINKVLPFEFKWIENIGVQVIKSVKLLANDSVIQEFSGQYLLNMVYRDFKDSQKDLFSKMIGNTEDLNDPSNYLNRNGNYPNAVYYASMPYMDNKMPYGLEPSIRGKQLYIPLNFWNTLNNKTPLPLISMQYTELKIQIELRPVDEWWRIRDVCNDAILNANWYFNDPSGINFSSENPSAAFKLDAPYFYNSNTLFQFYQDSSGTELQQQKRNLLDEFNLITQYFTNIPRSYVSPRCNKELYNIKYFLKEPPPKIVTNPDIDYIGTQIPELGSLPYPFNVDEVIKYYYDEVPSVWFPDIHLIGTYTFLDEVEQKELATKCQSYLIKEVHEQDIYDLIGGDNFTNIETQGLVVSWMWYFQRSDINKRNEWSNYSNFKYNFRNEKIVRSLYGLTYENSVIQSPYLGKLNNLNWLKNYDIEDNKQILLEWGIYFDNLVRETKLDAAVSAWVDRYRGSKGSGIDGVYYYNFCLETSPFIYQPSGAINISKFNVISWEYNLTNPELKFEENIINFNSYLPSSLSVTCDPISNSVTNSSNFSYTNKRNAQQNFQYTYTLHIMEERYNILQIENGIANLVFARTI